MGDTLNSDRLGHSPSFQSVSAAEKGAASPRTPSQQFPRHRIEDDVNYLQGCQLNGGRIGRLNRTTYITVAATLFLVMALIHLLRIILGWHVEIGALSIPFWVSWLAVLVAGALAYFGFMQKR